MHVLLSFLKYSSSRFCFFCSPHFACSWRLRKDIPFTKQFSNGKGYNPKIIERYNYYVDSREADRRDFMDIDKQIADDYNTKLKEGRKQLNAILARHGSDSEEERSDNQLDESEDRASDEEEENDEDSEDQDASGGADEGYWADPGFLMADTMFSVRLAAFYDLMPDSQGAVVA